jgi:hypothetical protein
MDWRDSEHVKYVFCAWSVPRTYLEDIRRYNAGDINTGTWPSRLGDSRVWESKMLCNVPGLWPHQLYRVWVLETPLGLLIRLLQSQPHVTTITHSYFLRCYTFTQLTILTRQYSILFSRSLHNTLQIKPSIHTLHLLHIWNFRNDLLPRISLRTDFLRTDS